MFMNTKAKEFLFTLLNTPSPAGFESEGQRIWMNYVGPYADSVENDAYGNVWATLSGDGSSARLMLEAPFKLRKRLPMGLAHEEQFGRGGELEGSPR